MSEVLGVLATVSIERHERPVGEDQLVLRLHPESGPARDIELDEDLAEKLEWAAAAVRRHAD